MRASFNKIGWVEIAAQLTVEFSPQNTMLVYFWELLQKRLKALTILTFIISIAKNQNNRLGIKCPKFDLEKSTSVPKKIAAGHLKGYQRRKTTKSSEKILRDKML